MKRSALWKLIAVFLALALVAAACGDDDDDTASGDDGTAADDGGDEEPAPAVPATPIDQRFVDMDFSGLTLNVLTPETASEASGFFQGLLPFIEATGVGINLNSTRDATTVLNLALEGGDPPDIVAIPQPGRLIEFCTNGDAIAIPDDVLARLQPQFTDAWWALGASEDGSTFCGIPEKADTKSLVWYNTALFADNGWEVPTTWAEMETLIEDVTAEGIAPFCIGIESSDATGWPFTDWMEDFMLRLHGPEVYDQWVSHEIPFNDPRVLEVAEFIGDIWFTEGNVFGGRANIATTNFRDVAVPHINGECAMHRQASFAGAFYTENGATIGPDGDVSVFYLPPVGDEYGTPVLSAGVLFAAFNDKPETVAMLEFLGTTTHQEARFIAQGGGYFSPNLEFNNALLAPIEIEILDILFGGSAVRFDGSDNMPGEVGSGSFWREGTDYVSGVITAQEFVDNVEDSWPSQ
ncbi:MAG: ABC transporter substrate-binding protein [Acidimicrobiales bacterium]